ncbi:TPA: hypothetical protein DCS99_01345, partial [Candidatus Wolfebacteria bacterium]|nr:hypothetical protein [Candidatus Wolfebacteria bacterium]
MDITPLHRKRTARTGVTLIEFVVAFGIFTMLITIASGSFIRSMRVQRTSLQLMSVNDNMGITLEQMMREMRTGYHFCTATDGMTYAGIPAEVITQCQNLASGLNLSEIQFFNASNEIVRYRWINEMLEKGISRAEFFDPVAGASLCGDGTLDIVNGICYHIITGDNIKITNAYFRPSYNDDGDGYSPRITLSFS